MQHLDTHFHLDFVRNRAQFLQEIRAAGVEVIAQTLTPESFLAQPADAPLALGFHPWNVESEQQVERQLALFDAALPQTQLIGEVGLDAARKGADMGLQVRVLKHIFGAVGPEHVMSIHAVRAVTSVLDLLEETACAATPVVHWFSGTSDELTRLMRMGGYISVNPRMLETKRGRAYVRQVPEDRLLLETDLPATPDTVVDSAEYLSTLRATHAAVAELRGLDAQTTLGRELFQKTTGTVRSTPAMRPPR